VRECDIGVNRTHFKGVARLTRRDRRRQAAVARANEFQMSAEIPVERRLVDAAEAPVPNDPDITEYTDKWRTSGACNCVETV
jgi:hypothetical protein